VSLPQWLPIPEGVESGGAHGWFPQPGTPQEQFVSESDDIIIFGGAAGGSKTVSLLLDFLRFKDVPGFSSVIFRRLSKHITQGGGLWDLAQTIYRRYGGVPNANLMRFTFPSGAFVEFKHLQYEQTKFAYQGAQWARIGFDEGTHFTESMFTYLASRLRTVSNCPTGVRLTCNPDADSWLAKFLEWWIDPVTGYSIPERTKKNRWMFRKDDVTHWFDDRASADKEMRAAYKGELTPEVFEVLRPKSVRFIPSLVTDNKILMRVNPDYVVQLLSQSTVDMERLLKSNWKIVAEEGEFRKDWFKGKGLDSRTIDRSKWKKLVRFWDLAATAVDPDKKNDPDWTVGALLATDDQNRTIVSNVIRGRWDSGDVEGQIGAAARADRQMYGNRVETVLEQEGGSSGKGWANSIIRSLNGFPVHASPVSGKGSKIERIRPFATQAKAGNVYYEEAGWNESYFSEICRFPFASHDDQVDATSGGHNWLTDNPQAGFSAEDYQRLYGGG